MAGLLDMLGMGGQRSGGGLLDSLQAQYAPGAYAAEHQRQIEQATEAALSHMQGMPPGMAHAFAMNPHLQQQLGGAYFPTAPHLGTYQTQSGETYPMQDVNPGGGPGHGLGISGIPITAPPGTTSSPNAALAPPSGGAPGGLQTTAGGMPGGTIDTQRKIEAAKTGGGDPFAALGPDAAIAREVHEGKLSLKDVADRRGNNVKTRVEMAISNIDPGFDFNRGQAVNEYRNSYMKPSGQGGIYFQRQAYDASLVHLNSTLDAALAMKPSDAHIAPLAEMENRARAYGGNQAALVRDLNSRVGILAPETDKFLGGKPATVEGTKEQRDKWGEGSTAREFAATGRAYLEMLEGKEQAMENEKQNTFNNPEAAKQFPISDAHKEGLKAQIRDKIARLEKLGSSQVQGSFMNPATTTAPPPAQTEQEIRVDAKGNKWTRDASGKVVPYGGK